MAETLAELGSDRAWIVHGADGTDEVSIAGETYVAELGDGRVTEFSRPPRGRRPRAAPARGDHRRHARRERPRACARCSPASPRPTATPCSSTPPPRSSSPRRPPTSREGVALAAESIDSGAARAKAERPRPRHRRRGGPADEHPRRDPRLQARRRRRPQGGAPARRDRGRRPRRRRRSAASSTRSRSASSRGYGLIAEIKKASPSKGLIRADFDPAALAAGLRGGRRRLPQRPDRRALLPGRRQLPRASPATPARCPVLRKDFLYDPWQVAESRALGADCILDHPRQRLRRPGRSSSRHAAHAWGMDVADRDPHRRGDRARQAAEVAAHRHQQPRPQHLRDRHRRPPSAWSRGVPVDRLVVSESGLATRQDLAQIARYGVRCFLIGETLMREENVEVATRELLRSPWTPEAG